MQGMRAARYDQFVSESIGRLELPAHLSTPNPDGVPDGGRVCLRPQAEANSQILWGLASPPYRLRL